MNDSASEFGKDLGLIHELVVAGRKVGFEKADWARLVHDPVSLEKCLDIARGREPILRYGADGAVADLHRNPRVPEDCSLLKHVKGPVAYDVRRTRFHHLPCDMPWQIALASIGVARTANACLLQFFVAYPQFIPEECQGRSIIFLGSRFYPKGAYHKNHVLRLEHNNASGWHEQITLEGIPLSDDVSFALL